MIHAMLLPLILVTGGSVATFVDRVDVKATVTEGQVITREFTATYVGKDTEVVWTGDAEPSRETEGAVLQEWNQRVLLRFTDKVLAVDGGVVAAFSRKWTAVKQSPKENPKRLVDLEKPKEPMRYERRDGALTFIREADAKTRKPPMLAGVLADLELLALESRGEVEVGESWVGDGAPLLALLNGNAASSMVAYEQRYRAWLADGTFDDGADLVVTLESVEDTDDGRMAVLSLELNAPNTIPWGDEAAISFGQGEVGVMSHRREQTLTVTGSARWSLDRGGLLELRAVNELSTYVTTCTMVVPSGAPFPEPGSSPEHKFRRAHTINRIEAVLECNRSR
jgi:hypothetical protein